MPHQQQCPKERLVQTALKLFATRGYHNTSIEDILGESDCTRGALYYYFSSKEELGYAAIDEELRLLFSGGAAERLDGEGHPIDILLAVAGALPNVTRLGTTSSSVTDVAARMAAVHEGFRNRLAQGLERALEQLEEMLRRGVAEGQIVDTVDPYRLARVVATMGAGIQFGKLLWNQDEIWEEGRRWLKEYLNSLRR